jgi:RND family efflux transporter MFP subunit
MKSELKRNEMENSERTPNRVNSLQDAPIKGLKSSTLRQTTIWGIVSTLVAVGFLAGCTKPAGGTGAENTKALAVEVPVQRVSARELPLRFDFTGHTIAEHEVEVRPRVGGLVTRAPFEEGAVVKAGTVLFELDDRPFVAAKAKADAEVARTQAAAQLALQELSRAKILAKTEAISVEELERRQNDAKAAEALLAAAIAQSEAAALDVEFTRITAPVSGRVGRALVKPGNLVAPGGGNGTLLTTLVTLNPMHVLFNLDEPGFQLLSQLRAAGTELRAELKIGQDSLTGKIDYIAPMLDPRSGTAQARALVPNVNGRLAPGQFARVTVIAETQQPRVLVPETAIGAQQGFRFVLLVDEQNTVKQRTVSLGERLGSERFVVAGLSAGESIVVNGLHRVRPGMTVQPIASPLASK